MDFSNKEKSVQFNPLQIHKLTIHTKNILNMLTNTPNIKDMINTYFNLYLAFLVIENSIQTLNSK